MTQIPSSADRIPHLECCSDNPPAIQLVLKIIHLKENQVFTKFTVCQMGLQWHI